MIRDAAPRTRTTPARLWIALLAIGVGGCGEGAAPPAPAPMPPELALSPVATLTHGAEVEAIAFSPDGTLLASGGGDIGTPDTVVLWDTARWERVASFPAFPGVYSLAFSPSGAVLFGGGYDPAGGEVRAWSVPEGGLRWVHDRYMPRALAVSSDGRWLAIGSADDPYVEILALPDGELARRFTAHGKPVLSLAFAADSELLLSGSADHLVRTWALPDYAEVSTFSGHTAPVWSVAPSPDGTYLASGTIDSTARLWQPDGNPVQVWYQEDWIWSVAFSPDGELLATGGAAGVRLYSVAGGNEPIAWTDPSAYATRVAFSPDGEYLVSALADNVASTPGTIRIWRVSR